MSFATTLSTDTLRSEVFSGNTALSTVSDGSGRVLVPEVRLKQGVDEEQEMSMHDLLEAILEQELFFGSVYY